MAKREDTMRMVIIGSLAICLLLTDAGYGAAPPHPLRQNPTPPKVSTAFQAEVARLAAQGLKLKEAMEASLEDGWQHLIAIFERPQPKEFNEANELRILESDGRAAKTIFRRPEFSFSFGFDSADGLSKLSGTDINGDSIKEVIVQSSSGGNCWSCNPTEIYRVKNHQAELIAVGPMQRVTDLDGDGRVELIVTDARWEGYDDFSHAAAPAAVIVYRWKDGKYVYACADFAAFYQQEAQRRRAQVQTSKPDSGAEGADDFYLGAALSLAITYAHMGQIEQGLKELDAILKANTLSAEQAARRRTIWADFHQGESFQKLRAMKYGDAMPLD